MRAKLLLFTLLIPLTIYAAGEFMYIGSGTQGIEGNTITLSVVDTGDTAKVYRISQFTGRDSFDYIDTIYVTLDTAGADSSENTVTWLSPLQVSRITLQTLDGRPNAIDTTIVYSCSLDAGTNKYGFAWSAPETGDDTLLSTAIAVLVDSINNTDGIKDTVTAEDSSTYVKLISLFAMDNLEGAARWTLDLGDSLTEGQRDSTNIEMVCDSMVALLNTDSASGGFSEYVTAANLTDTAYTITADKKGRFLKVSIGDTAQDTTQQQDTVSSVSTKTDTIGLGVTGGFRTLTGRIIMRPGRSGKAGFGLSDTASIWLETYSETGLINILDSVHAGQAPCTLDVVINRTRGDTLLYPYLRIRAYVEDSTTDTTVDVVYPIWFDLTLK
jgi:hypothetical protein